MPYLTLFMLPTTSALAEPIPCPPVIEMTPQVSVKPIPGWRPLKVVERHALADARLFDGDPAGVADLTPDKSATSGAASAWCGYRALSCPTASSAPTLARQ